MKRNKLRIEYERSLRLDPIKQKTVEVFRCRSIKRAHDMVHRGARKIKNALFIDSEGKEFNLTAIKFQGA